jgi:hypothetical protein
MASSSSSSQLWVNATVASNTTSHAWRHRHRHVQQTTHAWSLELAAMLGFLAILLITSCIVTAWCALRSVSETSRLAHAKGRCTSTRRPRALSHNLCLDPALESLPNSPEITPTGGGSVYLTHLPRHCASPTSDMEGGSIASLLGQRDVEFESQSPRTGSTWA